MQGGVPKSWRDTDSPLQYNKNISVKCGEVCKRINRPKLFPTACNVPIAKLTQVSLIQYSSSVTSSSVLRGEHSLNIPVSFLRPLPVKKNIFVVKILGDWRSTLRPTMSKHHFLFSRSRKTKNMFEFSKC